jgi:hypothetical protein
MSVPERRAYVGQATLLFAGSLLGAVLAWLVDGLPWKFTAELATARRLGVVSPTILMGYAKSRDLLTFAAALVLPVGGGLAGWLAARAIAREPAGAWRLFPARLEPFDRRRALAFAAALAGVAFLSWSRTHLAMPGWNSYVGGWPLLGEHGATLAWVESIRNGGVYGRDFFSLYGPMLVYPLAWLTEIVGPSVVVERCYRLALDLLGFSIVSVLLLRALGSALAALACALVSAMIFCPFAETMTANTTLLRSFLPLAALLAAAQSVQDDRPGWLALAGLVLGQSLLFSQEAGIAATLASSGALVAFRVLPPDRSFRGLARDAAWLLGALALSLAPMLGYLAANGALAATLDSVLGYPRLVLLGYGGLPFPRLAEWLADPFSDFGLHYLVIALYVAASLAIATSLFRRERGAPLHLALALLLYGLVLFRKALGRVDAEQTIRVMSPALLLAALLVDAHVRRIADRARPRFLRAGSALAAAGLVATFATLALGTPKVRGRIQLSLGVATDPAVKFGVRSHGTALPWLERGGVLFDADTAKSIEVLQGFLAENTRRGEFVYFFPNEAVYYFLFERANPTRYAISYFAASSERRAELIRDLERNRPRFVVFSPYTWRIDDIPIETQVPEVFLYLQEHYTPSHDLGPVWILTRKESG